MCLIKNVITYNLIFQQYQNGSNPIFDETLEYTLSKIDLDSNIKQVKVIVSIDKVMKNEVLGQVYIVDANFNKKMFARLLFSDNC